VCLKCTLEVLDNEYSYVEAVERYEDLKQRSLGEEISLSVTRPSVDVSLNLLVYCNLESKIIFVEDMNKENFDSLLDNRHIAYINVLEKFDPGADPEDYMWLLKGRNNKWNFWDVKTCITLEL
jgi:hypothetical protein